MEGATHFKKAGISRENGMLVVSKRSCSLFNKHYDVSYSIKDGVLTVVGDKPEFQFSLGQGEFDVDLIIEEDKLDVKKYWLFGKKIKVSRSGIVEFKERKTVTYTSNNYLIIE